MQDPTIDLPHDVPITVNPAKILQASREGRDLINDTVDRLVEQLDLSVYDDEAAQQIRTGVTIAFCYGIKAGCVRMAEGLKARGVTIDLSVDEDGDSADEGQGA